MSYIIENKLKFTINGTIKLAGDLSNILKNMAKIANEEAKNMEVILLNNPKLEEFRQFIRVKVIISQLKISFILGFII